MNEVVQAVRTIFRADSSSLRAELSAIQAATAQQLSGLGQLEQEYDEILRSMAKAEVDLAMMPVKIQKGFTNSAALAKTKFAPGIEGDLHEILSMGEKTMASDWMLDELERLRAASLAAAPAVAEVGQASNNARRSVRGLKDDVKDAIAPVDNARGAFNMLRENIGFVSIVGYGLVEAVEAIDEAFSGSKAITRDYIEAHRELAATLQNVARLQREVDELTGKRKPATTTQQKMRDIAGSPEVDGSYEDLKSKLLKFETRRDLLRREAQNFGFGFDANGNVAPPAGGGQAREEMFRAITDAKREGGNLSQALMDIELTMRAMREQEQAMHDLKTKEAWEAGSIKQALADAAAYAAEIPDSLASSIKSAMGAINSAEKDVGTFFSDFWTAAFDQEAQQKNKQAAADFWFNLTGIKNPRLAKQTTNIDARGSKITVNTKLETDDPARFANASVTGAFIGLVAKPLSATFGLGSPPLANGAR